ncbi:hypothetical protein ACIPRL_18910 [Streptomyces sp. NPDC090085]|uniref:hypothetical protein n=1 Tax=Streptomyces sp. NPDC090085 TaxID=3365943 RepID=UPI0037F23277
MQGYEEVADERVVLNRVREAGEGDGLAYPSLPSAALAVAELARKVDRIAMVEGEVDGAGRWRAAGVATPARRGRGVAEVKTGRLSR